MSKPGILSYKCAAFNCSNKYFHSITDKNYKNKKFFRFPEKDNSRRKNWFQIMNLSYSDKGPYLCEEHFEEKCFSDSNRTRLSKCALPFNNQKIIIIQDIQLVPPCRSQKPTTSTALATENINFSESIFKAKIISNESSSLPIVYFKKGSDYRTV